MWAIILPQLLDSLFSPRNEPVFTNLKIHVCASICMYMCVCVHVYGNEDRGLDIAYLRLHIFELMAKPGCQPRSPDLSIFSIGCLI